jgi:shikimate kinase
MKKTKNLALKPTGFPENIVLIGMFGSGKSTVGRLLAHKLRYHFIDVDHLIEARYRLPLRKVMDKLGLKDFMRMEDGVLQTLHYQRCVIAPGGSAVYYPKSMRHLKKLGTCVFLKAELKVLARRVGDWEQQPVVRKGGNTLPALFRERAPLYRKYADLTVEIKGKSFEKIASEILKQLSLQG